MTFTDEQLLTVQVHGTRNLRELALDLCAVGIRMIKEVVSRLHLLETLRLKGSQSAERIRITYKNLKHLALTRFDSLKRVKTQTPNLVSFQYDGPNIPIIGPRDSTRLANARLELDFGVCTKRRSYLKAAKFLRYFGRCDSLTLVCNEIEALILPEEIRSEMLPPLGDVKHLRLQIRSNTPGVDSSPQLTESLRWMCPHLEMLVVSSEPCHKETPPANDSRPRRDKYSRAKRKMGGMESAEAAARDAFLTKKTRVASSAVGSSHV
ncbi:hypothetical protein BT93_C1361 [Corymbia citriodora subsp. variegata]|nr:hypothetical protein BT93_C1361 [Corymbia citriodora subsp. variegata]